MTEEQFENLKKSRSLFYLEQVIFGIIFEFYLMMTCLFKGFVAWFHSTTPYLFIYLTNILYIHSWLFRFIVTQLAGTTMGRGVGPQHCTLTYMSHPKLSFAAGTPTKCSALKGPATKDLATKGSVYKRSCDQRSATVLVPLVSLPSTSGSLWQAGCLPYIM